MNIIVKIFGLACLFWAVLLTIGVIKEKGKCFVENKKFIGYIIIVILYILGYILVF